MLPLNCNVKTTNQWEKKFRCICNSSFISEVNLSCVIIQTIWTRSSTCLWRFLVLSPFERILLTICLEGVSNVVYYDIANYCKIYFTFANLCKTCFVPFFRSITILPNSLLQIHVLDLQWKYLWWPLITARV